MHCLLGEFLELVMYGSCNDTSYSQNVVILNQSNGCDFNKKDTISWVRSVVSQPRI